MKYILLLLILIPFLSFSQVNGKVQNTESKEPIVGAKIIASNGEKVLSDSDGKFGLLATEFPITLITSMISFENDTTIIEASGDIIISLGSPITNI